MKKKIRLFLVLVGSVLFVMIACAGAASGSVHSDAVRTASARSIAVNPGTEKAQTNQNVRVVPTATPQPEPTPQVHAEIAPAKIENTYEYTAEQTVAFGDEEKEYIARVVYAESRGENFGGQVAVATVVINRFLSGEYGKTVKKVAFAPSQFAVSRKYDDSAMLAVDTAINMLGYYPEDMFYFRVSKSKKWRNFEYYTRIGNHSFYCAGE